MRKPLVLKQYAELGALEEALSALTISTILHRQTESESSFQKLRIFSDCKSALQALQNPHGRNGQSVLKRIEEKLGSIRVARGPEGQFQWVPAHSRLSALERREARVEGSGEG